MTLTEPRLRAALDAAMTLITSTVVGVAERIADNFGLVSESGPRVVERDLLTAAQLDLRREMSKFRSRFADELHDRIKQDTGPRAGVRQLQKTTDWHSLSLVDDSEMEQRMRADRLAQMISHTSENELRELATYMGSLLIAAGADPDHDPLRPATVGAALYSAIQAVSERADVHRILTPELGRAVAAAMPACYAQIVTDLRNRGVRPIVLAVRSVEGPGNQLPGYASGYASMSSLRNQLDADAAAQDSDISAALGLNSGNAPLTSRGGPSGPASRGGPVRSQADLQLMALLRRLTVIASRPGVFDPAPHPSVGTDFAPSGSGREMRFTPTGIGAAPANIDATGMMAVNLIRAHREELMQASTGRLDHMVIDVVGSLFDQILSDSRVPPHMARQIARLQLPVLRVSLNDSTFFSSRRHPVRRFVNRLASLACAFDSFDEDPGKQFLARVRVLVQEIVDGDFDQVDLYAAKLESLESFIAEEAVSEAPQQATIGTLHAKEAELRLQQRYTMQLQRALASVTLPPYLREFLPQIWGQALVLASTRDGPDSERAHRFRRVGRDLVMSVQPKGSTALRKTFLMQLPKLMKDLNEGLQLIGWPDAAQRAFFGNLLPAHAESLKGKPLSELDHNMLVKQLEAVFNIPVPGTESLSAADDVPDVEAEVIALRFSADEAARVGLVQENAVDWSGVVDIDLAADEPVESAAGSDSGRDSESGSGIEPDESESAGLGLGLGLGLALDLNLDLSTPEPPEPTRGPQLIDHINVGFAYQMHLKDEWQKVRLAHVSAGRSFFVFTRGRKHQETISMTARMLARMCETGRMRAVENAYLMERATLRARKQLAALKAAAPH